MKTDNPVKKSRSTIQMNLLAAAVALVCGLGSSHAFATTPFVGKIHTCNDWMQDGSGAPAYYDGTTRTPMCTDYFNVGNFANSPLPAGTITGFTILNSGTGYINPAVFIKDTTVSGTPCSATATTSGDLNGNVITGLTPTGNCAGYTIPQVTIVDLGLGGTLSPFNVTCGAAPLTACGTGAMATAVIGAPFVTGTGIRKFQDIDALPDLKTTKATPNTSIFPGSDYYEIALVEYNHQFNNDLPPTRTRGYVSVPTSSPLSNSDACTYAKGVQPNYLGPLIQATKNVPVRVKFINCLAITGSTGVASDHIYVPFDKTYEDGLSQLAENRANMHLHGGVTPWISDGTPSQWTVPVGDGAAIQKGQSTSNVPDMFFKTGNDGTVYTGAKVPQCHPTGPTPCFPNSPPSGYSTDPGHGAISLYYTNQQGGRLMWYHDHSLGITRLNVYMGETAPYLLVDPVQEDMLAAASVPGTWGSTPDLTHLIPLVIQEKTFVPSKEQLETQDPTWINPDPSVDHNFGYSNLVSINSSPKGNGDLWFPHVYMTNQNPLDPTLANGWGRWDYGPWFFPPQSSLTAATPLTAVTVGCTSAAYAGTTVQCPITPNPSGTPESFGDTSMVNGKAYPVLHVAAAAYRFPILNATNDRSLNLSWFVADSTGMDVSMVQAAPPMSGSPLPLCTSINPVAVPSLDLGLATALLDTSGNPLNGTGLPAGCWPNYGAQPGIPASQTMWTADGRAGGVPDPTKAGPPWIQIATEGGLLPNPVVIPATPNNFEGNTRSITITSVGVHGLWLGSAERAEVIVDFSKFSGKTLILYNDAPAPAPAFDSRLDYYTGDPDQTPIGGAPSTQPGYGPNTRTLMKVYVDPTLSQPNTVPFSLQSVKTAFITAPATATTAATTSVFAETQPKIIVPEAAYNSTYGYSGVNAYGNTYANISANSVKFQPYPELYPLQLDAYATNPIAPSANPASHATQAPECYPYVAPTPPYTVSPQCVTLDQKTIQELFTADYGRMNATLGVEIPFTNFLTQTTIPLGYVDPPTEIIKQGDTQLWKITHNGVDTHFVHVHLFNVQVVNRMGWDGSLRQPDANELGWKDTVRMNPLEDVLVALQPITPTVPFPVPDSIGLLDANTPVGFTAEFTANDPFNLPNVPPVSNKLVNFGWEYVWHCHVLGHEENDFMRTMIFEVAPNAPSDLSVTAAATGVNVSWTDNSASETKFRVVSSTASDFTGSPHSYDVNLTTAPASGFSTTGYGQKVTFNDTAGGTNLYYKVVATDDYADSPTYELNQYPLPFKQVSIDSLPDFYSPSSSVPVTSFTGAPATATAPYATALYNTSFTVTASSSSSSAIPSIGASGSCSVSSSPTGTAASANAIVTMTAGTGLCTLTATWGYGTPQTKQLFVNAGSATPTVGFSGAPATAVKGATFLVTATTNAGIAPSSIAGTSGICSVGTVTGSSPATAVVTMLASSGNCILSATWPATANPPANYLGGSATQVTVATLKDSVVSITGNPVSAVYDSSFTVTATTNASGTLTPTITGTANVCLVGTPSPITTVTSSTGTVATSKATVSMLTGAGDCVLTANWNATSIYKAQSQVVHVKATPNAAKVSITSLAPQITNLNVPQLVTVNVVGNGTGYPFGPAAPTGTVTVLSSSGNNCTATLSNAANATNSTGSCPVSYNTVGSRTFTVTYNGDTNYGTNTAISTTLVSDFSVGVASPSSSAATKTQAAAFTVPVGPIYTYAIPGITEVLSLTCNLPAKPAPGWDAICTSNIATATGNNKSVVVSIKTGTTTIKNMPVTFTVNYTVSYAAGGTTTVSHTSSPVNLTLN